ncbi:MAG: 23S rRNA (uracil(1939)-C(5))-methyltransferase RlmD [Deltaproteobacteria bacterium]|nr:23S rRNA (uracil(1939)-C(5))-methyltransferase RlmD [Deltaproteobacteria bacterium]
MNHKSRNTSYRGSPPGPASDRRFSRTSRDPRSKPSPQRGHQSQDPYEPSCPHYPHCIGCPLVNVPYPEQLLKKGETVARALAAYPSLAHLDVPPVIASPHRLGYRARVKLVVRSSRGEVATGLYVPGTHRVIDISSCPVHPRPVNQVLQYLKKKVLELGIEPYDERNDSGQLRYLDFRYSFAQRELSVTLVTRHRDFSQGGALARSLSRKFSFVSGVIQNVNEQRGNVIWGDRYRLIAGRDTLLEQVGSLKFAFPAGVFSQANPSTAKKLYDKVTEMAVLSGRETVLDLYCGVGPISLYVASGAHLVWGIDDSAISIATAKQNARRNGISNCRFFAGDAAEKLAEAKKTLGPIDVIVLNPPRKGVQAAAMDATLSVAAAKIIYVSCDPKSLARDLDRLVSQDYRVRSLQPFDMFPQTEQVETVVSLTRA